MIETKIINYFSISNLDYCRKVKVEKIKYGNIYIYISLQSFFFVNLLIYDIKERRKNSYFLFYSYSLTHFNDLFIHIQVIIIIII